MIQRPPISITVPEDAIVYHPPPPIVDNPDEYVPVLKYIWNTLEPAPRPYPTRNLQLEYAFAEITKTPQTIRIGIITSPAILDAQAIKTNWTPEHQVIRHGAKTGHFDITLIIADPPWKEAWMEFVNIWATWPDSYSIMAEVGITILRQLVPLRLIYKTIEPPEGQGAERFNVRASAEGGYGGQEYLKVSLHGFRGHREKLKLSARETTFDWEPYHGDPSFTPCTPPTILTPFIKFTDPAKQSISANYKVKVEAQDTTTRDTMRKAIERETSIFELTMRLKSCADQTVRTVTLLHEPAALRMLAVEILLDAEGEEKLLNHGSRQASNEMRSVATQLRTQTESTLLEETLRQGVREIHAAYSMLNQRARKAQFSQIYETSRWGPMWLYYYIWYKTHVTTGRTTVRRTVKAPDETSGNPPDAADWRAMKETLGLATPTVPQTRQTPTTTPPQQALVGVSAPTSVYLCDTPKIVVRLTNMRTDQTTIEVTTSIGRVLQITPHTNTYEITVSAREDDEPIALKIQQAVSIKVTPLHSRTSTTRTVHITYTAFDYAKFLTVQRYPGANERVIVTFTIHMAEAIQNKEHAYEGTLTQVRQRVAAQFMQYRNIWKCVEITRWEIIKKE